MSIHPSLTTSEKDKKPRSVIKRIERLRLMLEKGQWKEGDDVFGLPKIKTVRIKIKKEKAAATAESATPAEGAATATPEAQTKKKEAAPAKGAKGQEKK